MHDGECSQEFGLPGIPAESEWCIVARDIELAEETGCALHIQHISSAKTVELIRAAQARGLPVSGEASPHHLFFADVDVDPSDANYKMNPPLRSKADRAAIRQGVASGVLGAFATDHAPHSAAKKAVGFIDAPFGIIGLETAVGITYSVMVQSGLMSMIEWLRRWTTGPCEILGLPLPSLAPGSPANVTVLDLEHKWVVDPADFVSRSRNTPFTGCDLWGHSVCTIHAGRIAFQEALVDRYRHK